VPPQGKARAQIIQAKGSAEAERIAAEGALKAAQLLEQSPIARELAKIDRTGKALEGKTKFFFGNGLTPGDLGSLIGAGVDPGAS
jgi:regulator of protease activity HflC (stomatin/prohibitin superfamily)